MDGWVGGLMDEWVGVWMDGFWADGWMVWIDGWIDVSIDGFGRVDRWMVKWMDVHSFMN